MAILTKEQIVAVDDLQKVVVNVPEWGGEVIVRCLTGQERDEFESLVVKESNDGSRNVDLTDFRARLVALSIVDEQGNRVFTLDDVKVLTKKSSKALDRVFNAAEKLSALRKKDEDDIVKNL